MKKKFENELFRSVFVFVFFISFATLIGYFFDHNRFPQTNTVIIYILAVLLISRFTDGYVCGIFASIVSTFAFNYFFTIPYYTFSVNNPDYIITFVIMTITSIITSALTTKIKQNVKDAVMREEEAKALYKLTKKLTDAADIDEIERISIALISEVFQCSVGFLRVLKNGEMEETYIQQIQPNEQVRKKVELMEEFRKKLKNWKFGVIVNYDFYDWPIRGKEALLGIVRIPVETAQNLNETQIRLLHTMMESTSLAIDRYMQLHEKIRTNQKMVQERYRGNLLRSISHDLRTPLSVIMGTSDMLMDMTKEDEQKYELAYTIYKDADWLRNLVENILNLTRLQEGSMVIHKEPEAVEEVIGSAVQMISKRLPEYKISVLIPDDLLFVSMDAKLIEQVLINLLDNAIKHSSKDEEIEVKVEKDEQKKQAVFSVTDHGEGILEEDLPLIFDMFYTSKTKKADVKHGIGLGLIICKTIVNAHGGSIEAKEGINGKGAVFKFTLPIES